MSLNPSPLSEHQKSSSKNPIALRLYKVLGTNYDDPAIRESLLALSKFYQTAPGLASEAISEPDSTGTGFDDALERQKPVIEANSESVALVRKNLKHDLQTRLEAGSHKFLKAFEVVDQVIKSTMSQIRCLLDSDTESCVSREMCCRNVHPVRRG